MAQQAAALVVQPAVALLADSWEAALEALQADAAAQAVPQEDAVVAAETSGALALIRDGQRSRRTLSPRSSFYPPCPHSTQRCPCASQGSALTLSGKPGNREPDTTKASILFR